MDKTRTKDVSTSLSRPYAYLSRVSTSRGHLSFHSRQTVGAHPLRCMVGQADCDLTLQLGLFRSEQRHACCYCPELLNRPIRMTELPGLGFRVKPNELVQKESRPNRLLACSASVVVSQGLQTERQHSSAKSRRTSDK